MNILYLLFSFTTGGTERMVTDICAQMLQRDHNVHLYIVNDHYDQSMLEGLPSGVQVHLQNRPIGGGSKISTLLGVARYIRKNHIQIVHCQSVNVPELLLLKPILFPKVKILYTIHSTDSYSQLSPRKIAFRNKLCHRLIAVSEGVRKEMLRCGAAPDKLLTIHNAIDPNRFPSPADKPFDKTAVVIGNVARIAPSVKGQDILIDALNIILPQHPSLQCYFAGAVTTAQKEAAQALQDRIAAYNLQEQVHFLGNVEKTPEFLQTLDVFVLPSRSEAFGISLVEAMVLGIPCIACDLEGPKEVLQNGDLGLLFQTGDPQDLAAKLLQLLSDYETYKEKALRQADAVRKQYSIVHICDKLEEIMI